MAINPKLKQLLFNAHGIPQNPGLHNYGINKKINNIGDFVEEKYEKIMNDKIHSVGNITPTNSYNPQRYGDRMDILEDK